MGREPIEELMARLRREYLEETPARLVELRAALEVFMQEREPEGPPLATLFHRLAGSAGAYGFGDVSALCRDTEMWLGTNPARSEETGARLARVLATIEQSFRSGPTTESIA